MFRSTDKFYMNEYGVKDEIPYSFISRQNVVSAWNDDDEYNVVLIVDLEAADLPNCLRAYMPDWSALNLWRESERRTWFIEVFPRKNALSFAQWHSGDNPVYRVA